MPTSSALTDYRSEQRCPTRSRSSSARGPAATRPPRLPNFSHLTVYLRGALTGDLRNQLVRCTKHTPALMFAQGRFSYPEGFRDLIRQNVEIWSNPYLPRQRARFARGLSRRFSLRTTLQDCLVASRRKRVGAAVCNEHRHRFPGLDKDNLSATLDLVEESRKFSVVFRDRDTVDSHALMLTQT